MQAVQDPDEQDDVAPLVARVVRREPDAEAELCRLLWPFVRQRVEEARRRRNWFWLSDPEGVVQDVFSQFFTALRDGKYRYEGRRRLEGFLVRTAFYVAMNLKDRVAKERAVSLYDDEEGGLRFDVAAFAEAVPDGIDRAECLKLLARAIGGLNPNRRDVIERTLLGQKVREICAATGKSPASISGLKFNAFVDLRRLLDEAGFAARCGALFGLERAS